MNGIIRSPYSDWAALNINVEDESVVSSLVKELNLNPSTTCCVILIYDYNKSDLKEAYVCIQTYKGRWCNMPLFDVLCDRYDRYVLSDKDLESLRNFMVSFYETKIENLKNA